MADEQNDNELLTDEERAALEADEGEEIDGSASLTGEETQEWIDNGWGAASNDAAQDNDTVQATQGDDTASTDEQEQQAAQQQDDAQQQRQQVPVDTSEQDQKIADLRSEASELFDKYDDGDLSREELEQEQARINEQIDAAVEDRAIARRRIADETAQWNEAVSDYFKEYSGLKDQNVVSAFDAEVRAVTSNPAFESKSFTEQLAIAHKRLLTTADDLGLQNVPPIKGQERQQQNNKEQHDPRGDELRTPPKTLARIPASDMNDAGDSKFAALQRLVDNGTPDEVEHALSQLSEEERNQFSSMVV